MASDSQSHLTVPAGVFGYHLLADSRRRQGKSLEEAFTATLKHVPFPVRGIVKKVLLG